MKEGCNHDKVRKQGFVASDKSIPLMLLESSSAYLFCLLPAAVTEGLAEELGARWDARCRQLGEL